LNNDPTLTDDHRGRLRERMAILRGSAAIIRVGGMTEVELGERRDRIVDALSATQAAAAEGIVPGGGTALYRIACALRAKGELASSGIDAGRSVVYDACSAPMRQMLDNAGHDAARVMAKFEHEDHFERGFDAHRGMFCDMFEAGIVDPVKVTVNALENAVSVAGMILTVGASIVNAQ
jgi:chaperonin GroEL